MSEPLAWRVAPDDAGQRLDRYLAQRLEKPRNQIQKWIAGGRVRLNDRDPKPSETISEGDRIECRPPLERLDAGIEPEPGALEIVYEDADLIVVDKAPGITIHPGAGRESGTLAHFLLDRYPELAPVGGHGRPGIVHRLDKDTSGLLLVARSEPAYQALTRAFAEREIEKTYLAIAYGKPRQPAGEISLPIARHRGERKKMAVSRRGRPARSRYRCLGSGGGIALFEIDLETGRTHQIRVHMKAIGHPLVGDPVYGEKRWRNLPRAVRGPLERFPRPALHAWKLALAHPVGGRGLAFEAPVPEDLRRLWSEVAEKEWPG